MILRRKSVSPSANSGEKISLFCKKCDSFLDECVCPNEELELLRELETALRAWRYAQLWNAQDLRRANDAMDKLDALRKSDAPGEE